jgi:hypothetical protein
MNSLSLVQPIQDLNSIHVQGAWLLQIIVTGAFAKAWDTSLKILWPFDIVELLTSEVNNIFLVSSYCSSTSNELMEMSNEHRNSPLVSCSYRSFPG